MKRKDRGGKTSVFVKNDDYYKKFKEIVKERGLTIQGVFDNFVRKVAKGEIDVVDIIRESE